MFGGFVWFAFSKQQTSMSRLDTVFSTRERLFFTFRVPDPIQDFSPMINSSYGTCVADDKRFCVGFNAFVIAIWLLMIFHSNR